MATPCNITRALVISGGMNGRDDKWLITNTLTVDGIEMISLSKSDCGFSKFVTGKPRGMSAMKFLDTLRAKRTKATFVACNDSMFDVPLNDARAKKAYKQKYTESGIPNIVEVQLPGVGEFATTNMKCQASLDVRTQLCVELRGEILDHIAALMRESLDDEYDGPMKVAKGVRWSSTRKAYLATREGSKKRMRTFRPEKGIDHNVAMEEAKQKAVAWATNDEDTSSAEDEDDEEGEHEDD